MMTKRDEDVMDAAEALCHTRHPRFQRGGHPYCPDCMRLTDAAVIKLEELGWRDSSAIEDKISNSQPGERDRT